MMMMMIWRMLLLLTTIMIVMLVMMIETNARTIARLYYRLIVLPLLLSLYLTTQATVVWRPRRRVLTRRMKML
jgi:hypothetical protein